jgi:Uncharacterized conserved protein
MEKAEIVQIVELIRKEVVPAIGCTEPMAVALCVAKATELLGKIPDKITVHLSANVLKNAMGVGIPGTGMVGLPIAIALGSLIGKSEYRLEVLKDCTPEDVEHGKQMLEAKKISILLKKNISEKLYIEAECEAAGETTCAIIAGEHSRFVHLTKGDEVLLNRSSSSSDKNYRSFPDLTFRKVYDFATVAPFEDIKFILESARMNREAAACSFENNFGHCLGKTLQRASGDQMLGTCMFSHILSYTSAACDARMAGAMIPVMSNSGSGNQGIAATIPVSVYAEDTGKSEEELARALILSHLSVIYIKQYLGRLSALCGCVVAATGSACGITYLMGGDYEKIVFSVKNMIANLTGMICDGAKPGCTLKVTGGVSTAVLSAMLAMEDKCVTSVEGIIEDDVDKCIQNLTRIGSVGMNETDKMILDIMTGKS